MPDQIPPPADIQPDPDKTQKRPRQILIIVASVVLTLALSAAVFWLSRNIVLTLVLLPLWIGIALIVYGAQSQQKSFIAGGAVLAAFSVLGLILFGLTRNPVLTANIRDIMIIFLGAAMLAIGIALAVLSYQLAMLTVLLRDEIKPLMESANETANTLRGTAAFMSKHLVEPTIKTSSTLAGVQRVLNVLLDLRPGKGRKA
ncbi:MAG: hypothetical protein JW850_16060 [Thermoflexales bacterium]|nr:hypothetical protein [Thermoflexales bacterium]